MISNNGKHVCKNNGVQHSFEKNETAIMVFLKFFIILMC